jgi:hypothetical protein
LDSISIRLPSAAKRDSFGDVEVAAPQVVTALRRKFLEIQNV